MTTTVTIRLDQDLKQQAEALFADLGMNLTTAFTIFAKAAVRQGGIPFEITAAPAPGKKNHERLRQAVTDLDAGRNIVIKSTEKILAAANE